MKKRNTKENAIRNVPFSLRVNTLNVEEATQQLAKNNPDGAIKNADNYSFHYCAAK